MKKWNKKLLVAIIVIAGALRLYGLNEVPVSLFGDELDVGYHAFSILKTGKDYSGNSWPLHFQSLAEWRTPLYLYSCVPTVALFGISPLGVRLPAAIFGILGVWGISLLVNEILGQKKFSIFNFQFSIGEVAALMLAISPWHIQYSRAAFEVTQLLAFLIFGLYFFFRSVNNGRHPERVKRVEGSRRDSTASSVRQASFQNDRDGGKYLWLSVVLLTFTPWIYSTAKLFTPLLLLALFILWRKELFRLPKRQLTKAVVAGLMVGLPVVFSTLFGGGSQRFGYISVFSDPTRETEIGFAREFDARVRGEMGVGLQPTLADKAFHNKLTFWGKKISDNFLQSLSTDFLFINGDPNLRHSINGMGQFYKIELVALLLGIIFFFTAKVDTKLKALIVFWILAGILPASITRDGGNHATRLILILPPLVFLISYGLVETTQRLKDKYKLFFHTTYYLLLATCFVFYQHQFWIHNPWNSERWWHSGFRDAIQSIKVVEKNYDKVIISMQSEPAWIFFAAHYEYPPEKWHNEFPVGNDVELFGFGKVSHTDKFYFGSPQELGLYDWGKIMDEKTLYMASEKEVGINLIREPERAPSDLQLIKSIAYPSGEPAFYLFSGTSNEPNSI